MESDTTITKVNRCFSSDCPVEAVSFCRHCGQEFCLQHRSKVDERFCSECISDESTQLSNQPIIDVDGVTHQGRQIKLIGEGWPASMEMICTLDDQQLEFKIGEWKKLLAEAIRTSEYFRITVCAAEFEKEDRYRSKVRKLQRRREELQKQGAVRLNGQKRSMSPSSPRDPAELLAKQLNISIDQARQVMKVLGKT